MQARSARIPILVLALVALLAPGPFPFVAHAQEATPAGTIVSPTREQAWRQVLTAVPMEEPHHRGGRVVFGVPSDITTLNPLLVGDIYSQAVVGEVYEGLVGIGPIDGQPMPALADSWELAPDGITYTFHLNQEAKWHDGADVTAGDVAFTYAAALDEGTGSPVQSTVAAELASSRVVDPDTVELTSNGKLATFLFDVAWLPILPKHLWEGVPFDQWASDPGSTGADPSRVVGTGPFRLAAWVPGDHATLLRNDAYYGAVPVIDEYIVAVYPDEAATAEALKAGRVDIADFVPVAQVDELGATAGVAVATFPSPWFAYYLLNLDPAKTTLFQDRAVREALFVALDRRALVDAAYLGLGQVAQGTQPPVSFAYAPDRMTPAYAYDPERARALLAEAGWADADSDGTVDKGGQAFAFELMYRDGNADIERMLPAMQAAWRAIGVAMTPKPVPFPALAEALDETHDFAMVALNQAGDASGNQGYLFRCDAYAGGFNSMRYCNPAYDTLDDQQLQELDPAVRRELLIQEANIIWDDLPIGVIADRDGRVGYRTRLHNVHPTGWGGPLWSLPRVWVEP